MVAKLWMIAVLVSVLITGLEIPVVSLLYLQLLIGFEEKTEYFNSMFVMLTNTRRKIILQNYIP